MGIISAMPKGSTPPAINMNGSYYCHTVVAKPGQRREKYQEICS